LAFCAWAIVAPIVAGVPPSGSGLARVFDWLAVPLVAQAAAALSKKQWTVLGATALVTLSLSSAAAGLQHFGAWPREEAFAKLTWLGVAFSRVYEVVPGTDGRFMGGGLLFHRLKYAHVSSLVMVAAVVMAHRSSGHARATTWLLATLNALAVWLFPFARMGAVAMSLGAGITAGTLSRSRRRAALVMGAVALTSAVVVLLVTPIRDRFKSALTDQGSGQRTHHRASAWRAIADHPIVGVGLGHFRPSRYPTADMPEEVLSHPGKAHAQFLSLAAETGIPGVALFSVMLLSFLRMAGTRPLGALVVGALAVFTLLSLAHDPLFHAPFSFALVLILGLGLAKPAWAPGRFT
jgi:O-antigen ligase